jgi:hypothetical protein
MGSETNSSAVVQRLQQVANDVGSLVRQGKLGIAHGADGYVQYNVAGSFGSNSLFNYISGTNTINVGNITGSALAMTIKPATPTSVQDAGDINIQAVAASGAAKNGGNVILTPSAAGSGAAVDGSVKIAVAGGAIALQASSSAGVTVASAYGVSPVKRATTTGTSAAWAAGPTINIFHSDDTYGGYTIGQVVQALKNFGVLT